MNLKQFKKILNENILTIDFLLDTLECDRYEELIIKIFPFLTIIKDKNKYNALNLILEQIISNYDIDIDMLIARFNYYSKQNKYNNSITYSVLRKLYYKKIQKRLANNVNYKKLNTIIELLIDTINDIECSSNLDHPKIINFSNYIVSFNFNDVDSLNKIIKTIRLIRQFLSNKIKELDNKDYLDVLTNIDSQLELSLNIFRKKCKYYKDVNKLLVDREKEETIAKSIYGVRGFKEKNINLYVPESKLIVPGYFNIITIDDDDSFDLDDAIFLEKQIDGNYVVHVYITHVTPCLEKNHIVDQEAYKREETVYILPKINHMLGDTLATKHLSLVEGQKRPVIEHLITLTPSGEVVSYDVRCSRITVKKRLDYPKVNRILQSGNESDSIEIMLHHMNALANNLKKRSNRREEYQDYESHADYGTSENIICEFSILANRCLAETFSVNGYPFVYRCHEEDKDAYYTPNNIGHYALNLKAYCHATSPIRRYPDIVNERMTERFIREPNISDKDYYTIQEQLSYDCKSFNESSKLAKVYLKYYNRQKKK